jgi:hypothetical protein
MSIPSRAVRRERLRRVPRAFFLKCPGRLLVFSGWVIPIASVCFIKTLLYLGAPLFQPSDLEVVVGYRLFIR